MATTCVSRHGEAIAKRKHDVERVAAAERSHVTSAIAYGSYEQVELIVIGQPTQLNGEPSESMKYITPFVNRLRKEMPDMPIVMYDERFTSTIAHQAMIDGGMKKSDRRDKSRVDAIAATIILNDYLQSIYNQ